MTSNSSDPDSALDAATSAAVPPQGRLAGIDYGTVRVGVAISDARQRLASPVETYTRQSKADDARYFQRLVAREAITGFVVGLPVHLHGGESQKSVEARAFGRWLAEVTGAPVAYYDERFSTADAEELLGQAELTKKRRKARLDMLAAQIMLSGFLESKHRGADQPRALDDDNR